MRPEIDGFGTARPQNDVCGGRIAKVVWHRRAGATSSGGGRSEIEGSVCRLKFSCASIMIADDTKFVYDKQGYVIVPGLIPTDLERAVREATERVIARTRVGEWPHRRTVGKQFPPFDNDNPDSWGVQHLMHPDLGEPDFAEWYTSGPLVQTICSLLGCGEGKLQMGAAWIVRRRSRSLTTAAPELFNLLINPESHKFALRWHRDDIREKASEDEERQALAIWHHGVSTIQPSSHDVRLTSAHRYSGIRRYHPQYQTGHD